MATSVPIDLPPCPLHCTQCHLRQSEAFSPVTAAELAFIEALRRGMVRIKAGGEIVAEQKTGGKLFTLYAGWAFRYKTLSDGRRQILNFLLPGDFIGLQEQFAEGATHGVEAMTDAALCVFARDGLWELFREYPNLGYDLTWLAAREESLVDENLLTAGRRNATERVAMLLIHLYRRAQRVGMVQDGSVEFPLNQQHIADALGLSLVHTNKTLKRLSATAAIRWKDRQFDVLDRGALARIAGEEPVAHVSRPFI